jgi:hypothetical protein
MHDQNRHEHIQATSIAVEDNLDALTITAVYSPPKHNTKYDEYERFFKTLGYRFKARGDYNAKKCLLGLLTHDYNRKRLHKPIRNNLQHLSSREPTYWPSDTNRLPYLLDFCIIRGIPVQKFTVQSCLVLTSDHRPILVTMFTHILSKLKRPSLYKRHTDWDCFREMLDAQINLEIPLKTEVDREEAVANLTNAIQQAA